VQNSRQQYNCTLKTKPDRSSTHIAGLKKFQWQLQWNSFPNTSVLRCTKTWSSIWTWDIKKG